MPHDPARRTRAWWAWSALACIAYVGLAVVGDWAERFDAFLVLYALAWVACWGAARTTIPPAALFAGAVAFRAVVLPLDASLSDDVYRYVWEGRVQAAGFNPFRLAPSATELEGLRDALWLKINHPDASAIYPPLAQLVFKVLALAGGVLTFKVAFAAADLATVFVLARALRQRRRSLAPLTLYAWNPLPIVEVCGSGHLEPLALLPMVLAITQLPRSAFVGWICLAASIAFKYAAALLVPIVALQARPRVLPLLAAGLLLLCTLLPYLDAGTQMFDSLYLYTDVWRYNDMLFYAVQRCISDLWWAKAVTAALLLAGLAVSATARLDLEARCLLALTALLALSPTLHAWYLLWIVVWLPLVPSRAVFVWSGTIMLAYLFLYPAFGVGPVDTMDVRLRLVEIVPVLIVLFWGRRAQRRGGSARVPTETAAT